MARKSNSKVFWEFKYFNNIIEDVLDLGEKFNDVLFVSRNNANLVERSTVNTNDILVLGEKINDSLKVSE